MIALSRKAGAQSFPKGLETGGLGQPIGPTDQELWFSIRLQRFQLQSHNNLTIKRPAWTASENVEKVGENRTASNCKGHKKDTAIEDFQESPRLSDRRESL